MGLNGAWEREAWVARTRISCTISGRLFSRSGTLFTLILRPYHLFSFLDSSIPKKHRVQKPRLKNYSLRILSGQACFHIRAPSGFCIVLDIHRLTQLKRTLVAQQPKPGIGKQKGSASWLEAEEMGQWEEHLPWRCEDLTPVLRIHVSLAPEWTPVISSILWGGGGG